MGARWPRVAPQPLLPPGRQTCLALPRGAPPRRSSSLALHGRARVERGGTEAQPPATAEWRGRGVQRLGTLPQPARAGHWTVRSSVRGAPPAVPGPCSAPLQARQPPLLRRAAAWRRRARSSNRKVQRFRGRCSERMQCRRAAAARSTEVATAAAVLLARRRNRRRRLGWRTMRQQRGGARSSRRCKSRGSNQRRHLRRGLHKAFWKPPSKRRRTAWPPTSPIECGSRILVGFPPLGPPPPLVLLLLCAHPLLDPPPLLFFLPLKLCFSLQSTRGRGRQRR